MPSSGRRRGSFRDSQSKPATGSSAKTDEKNLWSRIKDKLRSFYDGCRNSPLCNKRKEKVPPKSILRSNKDKNTFSRFWTQKSPGVNFNPIGPKDIRSFTPNSSTASYFVKPPPKKRQRLLRIANEVTQLMNPKTSSTTNSSVSSQTRRSRKEQSRKIEEERKTAKLKILEDKLKKLEADGPLTVRSKPRMRKLKSRRLHPSAEVQ